MLCKKGTVINKAERNALRDEINKGINMRALPFVHMFSHPTVAKMDAKGTNALVGHVLAEDLNGSNVDLEMGTVITEKDAKAIAKDCDEVDVYSGIYAQEVKVSNDNVNADLDFLCIDA